MKHIYSLNNIFSLKIEVIKPCIIFLKGDLSAGKTTISKYIINNILNIKEEVTSPTYTYYNKYNKDDLDIYHFDLYRLSNYEGFFSIGGEDILDNNNGVIIIEWPEIIEKYYLADIVITLKKTDNENEREIDIKYKKEIS